MVLTFSACILSEAAPEEAIESEETATVSGSRPCFAIDLLSPMHSGFLISYLVLLPGHVSKGLKHELHSSNAG